MIIEKALQEINTRYAERITELKQTGKIERAGDKDHVWYIVRSWQYKSNDYQQVIYGSWRASDQHTINSWDDKTEDKGFKKAYQNQVREASVSLELEKQKKHKACREKWLPIYTKAKPEIHAYLKHKNITSAFNSRIDHNDVMLIPAYHPDKFVGVQKIYLNPMTGKFEKKFASGIDISQAYCPLTTQKSEYIYISEGYATAATIQMAFPQYMSICAFNANNLWKVARTIRQLYPDSKIIIAADKDHSNTGEKEARKAVKTTSQAIYRLPKFPSENPSWTDFNDLMIVTSLDEIKEQLAPIEDEFVIVTPLGYLESDYFYTSTVNNQIIKVAASAHKNSTNLLQLASLSWWQKRYGVIDEESGKVAIKWDLVTSDLFAQCHEKGLFNPEKIRGRGVWKDGLTFSINNGETVFPANPESKFHYQKLIKTEYSTQEPFTDDEMDALSQAFQNLCYKNQKDYIYLAAWAVQAQIFACLPWRFHLWITGARGNGKSTILEWMNNLLPLSIFTNNATAAGIRQEIKNDACPVVYDETEAESGRMVQVIELARQMSSNSGAKTLRGTSGGTSITLNTQTIFLFGSIQIENLSAADASRIFVVEMLPTKGQSLDDYNNISNLFKTFEGLKHRLFSRCYQSIPSILASYNLTKKYLHEKQLEARLSDQISMLIACFWVYFSTEPINEEAIDKMVKLFNLIDSDYTEENEISDSEACMQDLMTMEIDQRDQRTLAFCLRTIHKTNQADDLVRYLGSHGMRYFPERKELFIAKKSDKVLNKMKRFPAYSRILARDKTICINPRSKQRVDGFGNIRGLILKISDSILTGD